MTKGHVFEAYTAKGRTQSKPLQKLVVYCGLTVDHRDKGDIHINYIKNNLNGEKCRTFETTVECQELNGIRFPLIKVAGRSKLIEN